MKKSLKNKLLLIGASLLLGVVYLSAPKPQAKRQNLSTNPSKDLQLNDGQKWEADMPARQYVRAMTLFMNDFMKKENISYEEYKEAGETLRASFNSIVTESKMKERAHEELQKFLEKLNPDIDTLEKGSFEKVATAAKNISRTLLLFKKYFK